MKRFKNFCAFLLAFVIVSAPSYARGNYTYTTIQNEVYNASSSIGTFTNYNGTAGNYSVNQEFYPPQQYYFQNSEFPPAPIYDATVSTNEPQIAYTSSTIETPQAYSRQVTNTTTFRDEREKADKVIDRSGRVLGILSGVALVGAFVTAIFCAI